jgi:putative endonuclease
MNQITKIKSYKFGILAEFAAIIFFRLKGYKILAQRYKTYVGEIDIIAVKGKCLVAVEVKARKNIAIQNGFLIDEVVGKNQRQRIKRAITSFVKANYKKYYNHNIRFDLIVISPFKFPRHFVGFWE